MIERSLTWILSCITLTIIVIIYYYHYNKWYSFLEIAKYPIKKYKEQKVKKEENQQKIRYAFKLAEDYLHRELDNTYLNETKYIELKYKAIKVKESYWPLANKVLKEFQLFNTLIKDEDFKEKHNEDFIQYEKKRYKNEFWSLTDAQKTAIFTDEDAVLVNAWAWTWKTKTIENKIKYLIKYKNIPLDKILVVTYSKEAQQDMLKRIINTLESEGIFFDHENIQKTISTFHAFGNWIVNEYERRYLQVWEDPIWKWRAGNYVLDETWRNQMIRETMEEVKQNSELLQKIIHYFYYYDRIIYNNEQLNQDTNKRYDSFLKENWVTVEVKSYWELLIANYLVEHWIPVQYEPKDEYIKDKNDTPIPYKPDFCINQWGNKVYIEYFWVDENNNVDPSISDPDEYVEIMYDKKAKHEKSGNKLVDIRYADLKQWTDFFLNKLEKKLKEFWITIWEKIEVDQEVFKIQITQFERVLSSFLSLYCECHKTDNEIKEKINELPTNHQRERAWIFYQIFKEYYWIYKKLLKKSWAIDFPYMITEARDILKSWYVKRDYKYILIDEFQDISKAKIDLIKELIKNPNETRLFCVWDDWQSIYKFTWSDLWIFLDFDTYFKHTKHITLDKTFRFNQWISNISGEFIMKNIYQTKKTLLSELSETENRITVYERNPLDSDKSYRELLENLFNDYLSHIDNSNDIINKTYTISCLYLTRYKLFRYKTKDIISMLNEKLKKTKEKDWYNTYEINYKGYTIKLKIKTDTIHWSKWLEADYVIIDNVNRKWIYTFPSKFDDDEVLDLCMTNSKYNYRNAEERRLFYVALTRGKRKAYLIYDKWQKSSFIRDLNILLKGGKLSSNTTWPHCWECWWDLIMIDPILKEYGCINWCDWNYFEYQGKMYKSPLCNCWKHHCILRVDWYQPYWPCENKHCRKYHKFWKKKYCIGYLNK